MDVNDLFEKCEIFTSLDKERIIKYCRELNIDVPEDDEILFAGVHKAICKLFLYEDSPITCQQFNESYSWLVNHGYVPLDEEKAESIEDDEKKAKVISLLEDIIDILKE